jgi:hypothetical protein
MMINIPKYPVEEVDGPLRMILDQATTHGWGTLETIAAMEEVLKHLRIACAEDFNPAEDPVSPFSEEPLPSNDWPRANL